MDDEDVIELNVGGQMMTTKRTTLCQVEGSLLAAMFSGRENSMTRDKDGRIFLDFNPTYFASILDYLRAKRISTGDKPASFPEVTLSQVKNFHKLIEYLGLRDEMFPKVTESFKEHTQGITLEENGTVAAFYCQELAGNDRDVVGYSQPRKEFVLGRNNYSEWRIIRLKLNVQFPDCPFGNIRVGMVHADVDPERINEYQEQALHGWKMKTGEVWYKRQQCCEFKSMPHYQIELILDNGKSMLFLKAPDGNQFDLKLPQWNTWRLLVRFGSEKKEVCIKPGGSAAFRVCILESKNISQ